MRGAVGNPGELSHLVELQRCERSSDALGGQLETWVKVSSLWARVSVQSQREETQGDHLEGRLNMEVIMRYRDDVEVGMRLLFKNQTLVIQSCADVTGQGCFLVCLCQAEK